jgi:hypothetical protein
VGVFVFGLFAVEEEADFVAAVVVVVLDVGGIGDLVAVEVESQYAVRSTAVARYRRVGEGVVCISRMVFCAPHPTRR